MNLRIPAAIAAALALAAAPAAQAKQDKHELLDGEHVCNTASQNWQGGDLVVSEDDPQGFVHYDKHMRKHNNVNRNAAMHSQALALCVDGGGDGGDGSDTDGGDGTTGGDGGGGPVGGGTT